jgi:hypothetical protein
MTTTYKDLQQKAIDAVNCVDKPTNQIRALERNVVVATVPRCVEATMARIREGQELIKDQNATIERQGRDLRHIKRDVARAEMEMELKPESSKTPAAAHTTEVLKEDPAFDGTMQPALNAAAAVNKHTNKIKAAERDCLVRSVRLFVEAARARDQEIRNVIQRQANTMALQLTEMKRHKNELARLTAQAEKIAKERRQSQAERRKSFAV